MHLHQMTNTRSPGSSAQALAKAKRLNAPVLARKLSDRRLLSQRVATDVIGTGLQKGSQNTPRSPEYSKPHMILPQVVPPRPTNMSPAAKGVPCMRNSFATLQSKPKISDMSLHAIPPRCKPSILKVSS